MSAFVPQYRHLEGKWWGGRGRENQDLLSGPESAESRGAQFNSPLSLPFSSLITELSD